MEKAWLAQINGSALMLQLHTPYLHQQAIHPRPSMHLTFAISHSKHCKHTAFCPCAQLST